MKSVEFRFNLDDKVIAKTAGFSGIVSMCAIQGDPETPEIVYYVKGATGSDWYAERLLQEAE
ncbi:MAG: hypothetical protein FWH41_04070 [Treponema sp.]|nr:hypothetical protein [Treponema sp.]